MLGFKPHNVKGPFGRPTPVEFLPGQVQDLLKAPRSCHEDTASAVSNLLRWKVRRLRAEVAFKEGP